MLQNFSNSTVSKLCTFVKSISLTVPNSFFLYFCLESILPWIDLISCIVIRFPKKEKEKKSMFVSSLAIFRVKVGIPGNQ